MWHTFRTEHNYYYCYFESNDSLVERRFGLPFSRCGLSSFYWISIVESKQLNEKSKTDKRIFIKTWKRQENNIRFLPIHLHGSWRQNLNYRQRLHHYLHRSYMFERCLLKFIPKSRSRSHQHSKAKTTQRNMTSFMTKSMASAFLFPIGNAFLSQAIFILLRIVVQVVRMKKKIYFDFVVRFSIQQSLETDFYYFMAECGGTNKISRHWCRPLTESNVHSAQTSVLIFFIPRKRKLERLERIMTVCLALRNAALAWTGVWDTVYLFLYRWSIGNIVFIACGLDKNWKLHKVR